MATHTKKKRGVTFQQNEPGVEDESNEEEPMDEEINEEIQVEFEAFPPSPGDFHGIKKLLQQLFLKSSVDLTGATDMLIAQNEIGCVLKQSASQLDEESDSDDENDDHVYAVTSILSLTDKQDIPCIQQIGQHLLTKCKQCAEKSVLAELQRILSNHNVGLLLSERFLNIPPQLAPHIFLSLRNDLDRAKGKHQKYNYDYYIMMCKSYQTLELPQRKKKSNSKLEEETRNTFYSNAEDELFEEKSVLTFKYSITEESDVAIGGSWSADEAQFKTFRTVMVIPASKLSEIVTSIQSHLGQ